jgi:hypothetical protein
MNSSEYLAVRQVPFLLNLSKIIKTQPLILSKFDDTFPQRELHRDRTANYFAPSYIVTKNTEVFNHQLWLITARSAVQSNVDPPEFDDSKLADDINRPNGAPDKPQCHRAVHPSHLK